MKQIFLTFALFLVIYSVSVVVLNILPESSPQEPNAASPQIQLQDLEASPSGDPQLPLAPDL